MSDIYRIACRLTFESNAASIMGAIAGHLNGLDRQMRGVEKQFKGLSAAKLAFFGSAGIIAGGGIFAGLKKVAEHGTELLDKQDKMVRLGVSHNDVLRVTSHYYEKIARQIPTSTAAGYLKTVTELRAVTGPGAKGLADAESLATRAMKFDALLENLREGGAGGASYGEFYKVLRSAEMKEISTNPKKLQEYTDQVFSLIEAFGGKLDANAFQLLAKRGGTSFARTDVKKALGAIAVMSADLGGDTAGTALMTLQQFQDGAGVLSKQQYATLKAAGLIDRHKVIEQGFGKVQMKPGALLGSLDYDGNLPGWIENVIGPHVRALAKREAAKDGHGDKWQTYYDADMAKIMRNRNAGRAAMMFSDPGFLDQRRKDLGLAKDAMGLDDAYNSFVKNDPKGVKKAFNDQYESMMQAIGAPTMQAALPVMKGITEVFTKLATLANAHPEVVKGIGLGIAAVGAALIGAGGAALLAAVGSAGGVMLGIGAGIGAIGAAVVGLKAFKPEVLSQIASGLRTMDSAIDSFFATIKRWIASLPDTKKMFGPQLPSSATPESGSLPGAEFQQQSYRGGSLFGGGLIKAAYTAGGGDNATGTIAVGTKAGFIDAMRELGGFGGLGRGLGSFGGAFGGGGGLGGGGFGSNGKALAVGPGTGIGHVASQAERAAYIRSVAAEFGINPEIALRVAQSEGFGTYVGDHGMSFGDFQLFTGGGIGNQALKAGINIRDPRNWKMADRFALAVAAHKRSWADWHGAARVGIGAHQGFDYAPHPVAKQKTAPTNIHNIHLDGKVIARIVTKHQVAENQQVRGIGPFDNHSMLANAGMTMFPV